MGTTLTEKPKFLCELKFAKVTETQVDPQGVISNNNN